MDKRPAAKKTAREAGTPRFVISGNNINAAASNLSPEAATALAELARASAAHAQALSAMANALKGQGGHIGAGITLNP